MVGVPDLVPDLDVTGHSLGGGLAVVAAARTGLSAITFNAASVHESLITRLGGSTDGLKQQVSAYYLRGDVVSGLQDNPVLDMVAGVLTPVKWLGSLAAGDLTFEMGYLPEAAGQRVGMTGWIDREAVTSVPGQLWNTLGLHSNQNILQSFYHNFRETVPAK